MLLSLLSLLDLWDSTTSVASLMTPLGEQGPILPRSPITGTDLRPGSSLQCAGTHTHGSTAHALTPSLHHHFSSCVPRRGVLRVENKHPSVALFLVSDQRTEKTQLQFSKETGLFSLLAGSQWDCLHRSCFTARIHCPLYLDATCTLLLQALHLGFFKSYLWSFFFFFF